MPYLNQTTLPLAAVPRWAQRLGLALLTASTLTLVACGGGGGSDNNASTPAAGTGPSIALLANAPPTLQSVSTDEATSVNLGNAESLSATATSTTSTTGATSTASTTSTMQVMRSAALDFDAKVKEGPSKDTQLKGKLQLNAKSTDGGKNFAVSGKLIQRDASREDESRHSDADKVKIKLALNRFYAGAKVDYEKFRLGVSALAKATDTLLKVQRAAWFAVPANAADAKAQYAAIESKVKTILDDFGKQLDALQASLSKDLNALNASLQAELQAIKPIAGTTTLPDITVTGTLTKEGSIALVFDLGAGKQILGVGQSDAKGKYTGTFTGPASGDKGTWSANPILCDDSTPGTGTTTMPTPTGTLPNPTGTTTTTPGTTTGTPTGTITGTVTGTGTGTVTGTVTSTVTGTVTVPPMPTSTVPGTTTGTVTMPNPGPDNCSGRVAVGAEISQIISATVFKVGKNISIGQYLNGIPFDASGAKFVNGSAANIVLGRRVQVCSDDTFSPLTASSPPPLKASTVIFQ